MKATDERLRQVRKRIDDASTEFLGEDCDLVHWLLDDRTDNALDAIEAIIRLRERLEAMGHMVATAEREIRQIRGVVESLRDMLPEEVTDV